MKNQSPRTQLGTFLSRCALKKVRLRRPGVVLATSAVGLSAMFGTVALAQPNPEAFLVRPEANQGQHDVSFGASIVVSDFNCDGIDDMVIGAPKKDIMLTRLSS